MVQDALNMQLLVAKKKHHVFFIPCSGQDYLNSSNKLSQDKSIQYTIIKFFSKYQYGILRKNNKLV